MPALLPDNPFARESVARNLATVKPVFVRFADDSGAVLTSNIAQT